MRKQAPYGVADYEELVRDNGYFVDKTMYIEKLERIKNPVFLRPRRFGKSLFCRILCWMTCTGIMESIPRCALKWTT